VDAIDNGDLYDSARTKLLALDRATRLQEMKAILGQPDFALGSVHAITRDGTLVIASALDTQLTSYPLVPPRSSSSSAHRSSSPTLMRPAGGSTSTASSWKMLARLRRRVRTAASARSSRSIKRIQVRIHVVLVRRHVGF
jgi:hypothetical protein